jgi:hypothetical protein
MNHLVVSEDVPDEIVYKINEVIANNLPVLRKLFAGAEEISLDRALLYNEIPVHPGAQKFYREKGIK